MFRAKRRRIANLESGRKKISWLPHIAAITTKKVLNPRPVTLTSKMHTIDNTKCKRKDGNGLYLADCVTMSGVSQICANRGAKKKQVDTSRAKVGSKTKRFKPKCWAKLAGKKPRSQLLENEPVLDSHITLPRLTCKQVLVVMEWDAFEGRRNRKIKSQRIINPFKAQGEKVELFFNNNSNVFKVSGEKMEQRFDFDEAIISIVRHVNCLNRTNDESENKKVCFESHVMTQKVLQKPNNVVLSRECLLKLTNRRFSTTETVKTGM